MIYTLEGYAYSMHSKSHQAQIQNIEIFLPFQSWYMTPCIYPITECEEK